MTETPWENGPSERQVESFLPADFVEIHTSVVCSVTRSACIRFESSLPAPVAIIATCSLGNNRFTSVSTRNSCIRGRRKKAVNRFHCLRIEMSCPPLSRLRPDATGLPITRISVPLRLPSIFFFFLFFLFLSFSFSPRNQLPRRRHRNGGFVTRDEFHSFLGETSSSCVQISAADWENWFFLILLTLVLQREREKENTYRCRGNSFVQTAVSTNEPSVKRCFGTVSEGFDCRTGNNWRAACSPP